MTRATVFLLLFTFLDISWCVLHDRVNSLDWHAENYVYNSVSDKQRSLWNIKGQITIEKNKGYVTLKLDDVQISVFNGHGETEDIFHKPEWKPLPKEAHFLEEPWRFYRPPKPQMGFLEDEPIWSANMKRGIMNSIWHENLILIPSGESIVEEELMYGKCNVTYNSYSNRESSELQVNKTISMECEDGEIMDHNTNTEPWGCSAWKHKQITRKTTRAFFTERYDLIKILARNEITFQVTPSDVHNQKLIQIQTFLLKNNTEIKTIDTSKITVKKSFKYEQSSQPMEGRIKEEKLSTEELTNKMMEKITQLKTILTEKTTENTQKLYENMNDFWTVTKKQTEKSLEQVMEKIKTDRITRSALMSILPYVGTNSTIKFLLKHLQTNANEMETILMMSKLGKYTNEYSKELLDDTRKAFDNINVNINKLKNNAELAFATLVLETKKKNLITNEEYDNYINYYFKLFKETKDHYKRLIYILALNNLKLSEDRLRSIIEDDKEKDHFKIIAMKAIESDLITDANHAKSIFLPILKNETQSLPLRVMALQKLIEFINEPKDFEEIYEYLKEETLCPKMQHLYNYLYSSIASNIEQTKCRTHMAEIAYRYYSEMKAPTSNSWITGDYTLSYTNKKEVPDFGAKIRVSLISDPSSSVLEYVDLNFASAALGLEKELSIQIRLSGAAELYISDYFRRYKGPDNKFKGPDNINDYLEIIKKHSLNLLKQKDFSIDIVVSLKEKNHWRALFATNYDSPNLIDERLTAKEAIDSFFGTLYSISTLISYPTLDYKNIPSDIGTDVTFSIEEKSLVFTGYENFEKMPFDISGKFGLSRRWYSTMRKSVDLWNPVVGMKQGVDNTIFKNYYWDMLFKLTYVPKRGDVIEFDPKDLHYEKDYKVESGIYINNEILLHDYCKKCKKYEAYIAPKEKQHDLVKTSSSSSDLLYNMSLQASGSFPPGLYYSTLWHKAVQTGRVANTQVFRAANLWTVLDYCYKHEDYMTEFDTFHFKEKSGFNFTEPVKIQFIRPDKHKTINDEKEPLPGYDGEVQLGFIVVRESDNNETHRALLIWKNYKEPGLRKQSLSLAIDVGDKDKRGKACLDMKFKIPPINSDYYSLTASKPAHMEMDLKFFKLKPEEVEDCSGETSYHIEVKSDFSVTDAQLETAAKAALEPFKTCKKDSTGLKYTAPTLACKKAHEEMNNYRKLNYYVDVNEVAKKEIDGLMKSLGETQGISKHFNLSFEFPKDEQITIKINGQDASKKLNLIPKDFLINSKMITNDMEDNILEIGTKRTCVITNKFISTFMNHTIKNYRYSPKSEIIGFIECTRAKEGLAFTPLENNRIGLKVWVDDEYVTATPNNGAIEVIVNDEKLEYGKFFTSFRNYVKIYYLSEDIIYIKGPKIQIYYNTEYARIEAYSPYVTAVCGLCSEQKQQFEIVK